MTLQSSIWYSTASYAVLLLIAVLAIYGLKTSVGGRPILDSLGAEK